MEGLGWVGVSVFGVTMGARQPALTGRRFLQVLCLTENTFIDIKEQASD